jgi:hypothetical protein
MIGATRQSKHWFASISTVWIMAIGISAGWSGSLFLGARSLAQEPAVQEPDSIDPSDFGDAGWGGDVWELSTRHLPDRPACIQVEQPGFQVFRYAGCRWTADTIESALDVGDRLPILYVHGNFMERGNTRQRVLILDQYMKQRATRPYRLYVLSWPSQKEPHPLRDVFDNAAAAECQALYLAWLLEKLGDQPQVGVLGFSFGSRSVTGALHLVSGGSIRGLHHEGVVGPEEMQSLYRVGLVAPAVDRNWLSAGGKHREAMSRVVGLTNLYNSSDPVLRRYRFLDRVTRPMAAGFLGFVGVEGRSSLSLSEPLVGHPRIRQYDCSGCVGNTHDERTYYRQCPYFKEVLDTVLWNEPIGSCIAQ